VRRELIQAGEEWRRRKRNDKIGGITGVVEHVLNIVKI